MLAHQGWVGGDLAQGQALVGQEVSCRNTGREWSWCRRGKRWRCCPWRSWLVSPGALQNFPGKDDNLSTGWSILLARDNRLLVDEHIWTCSNYWSKIKPCPNTNTITLEKTGVV
jgi:hypothetical protein